MDKKTDNIPQADNETAKPSNTNQSHNAPDSDNVAETGKHEIKETLVNSQMLTEIMMTPFPIGTGVIKMFDATRGRGFLTPDNGGKDIKLKDPTGTYEEGEQVEYVEVNNEATIVEEGTGVVKFIKKSNTTGKVALLFITPADANTKDVVARDIYPGSDYLNNFEEGDEVDFLVNAQGIVFYIKKKEA